MVGTCLLTEEKQPYTKSLRIRVPPRLLFPAAWAVSAGERWQLLPIPTILQPCHRGDRWSKKRCQVLSLKICGIFVLELPRERLCWGCPWDAMGVGPPLILDCFPETPFPIDWPLGLCVAPLRHAGAHKGPTSCCPFADSVQKGRAALFRVLHRESMELGKGKQGRIPTASS